MARGVGLRDVRFHFMYAGSLWSTGVLLAIGSGWHGSRGSRTRRVLARRHLDGKKVVGRV